MNTYGSGSVAEFTIHIPSEWKESIGSGGIVPSFTNLIQQEDVNQREIGWLLYGWEIHFISENRLLNLYLLNPSDDEDFDISEDDWILAFSVDDITNRVWQNAEIGDEKIRIQCLWGESLCLVTSST